MDVAMSFLMLASVTMMAMDKEDDNSKTILSSYWRQILSFFSLLDKLKEKWSEKLSMILEPRERSRWRGENKRKIPYNLLFESTKWPWTRDLWWLVRVLSEVGCWYLGKLEGESISDQMRWLWGSTSGCNYNLPTNFWRWSLIGIRPEITSIPSTRDILKAPSIHMVALLCIFPKIFSGYDRGV